MSEESKKSKKYIPYWPDVFTLEEEARKAWLEQLLGDWILRPSWTKLEAALVLTGFLPLVDGLGEDILEVEKPDDDGRITVNAGVDIYHTAKLYGELKKASMFDVYDPKEYIKWAFSDEYYRRFCMPGDRHIIDEAMAELIEYSIAFIEHLDDPRARLSNPSAFAGKGEPRESIGKLLKENRYISLIDYIMHKLEWWTGKRIVGRDINKVDTGKRRFWSDRQTRKVKELRTGWRGHSWKDNFSEVKYDLAQVEIHSVKDFRKCWEAKQKQELRSKE